MKNLTFIELVAIIFLKRSKSFFSITLLYILLQLLKNNYLDIHFEINN